MEIKTKRMLRKERAESLENTEEAEDELAMLKKVPPHVRTHIKHVD